MSSSQNQLPEAEVEMDDCIEVEEAMGTGAPPPPPPPRYGHLHHRNRHKTESEKRCDELHHQIEIKSYEQRIEHLSEHLKNKHLKEELQLKQQIYNTQYYLDNTPTEEQKAQLGNQYALNNLKHQVDRQEQKHSAEDTQWTLNTRIKQQTLEQEASFLEETLEQNRIRHMIEHKQTVKQLDDLDQQIDLDHQIETLNRDQQLADLAGRKRKRTLEETNQMLKLQQENEKLEKNPKRLRMEEENTILRLENEKEMLLESRNKRKYTNELSHLETQLKIHEAKLNLTNWANNTPTYLENPLQDYTSHTGKPMKEIVLSDRVIHLNGPIVYSTATHIRDRINYFNNQNNKLPIFLLIGYSPGGSVMAGYRITKAIESSEAPIYSVVQNFAASMAATIVTMTEHSYVLPDAIMLHHQMWGGSFGNITQLGEAHKFYKEWYNRFEQPVIDWINKRTGSNFTCEEWVKLMYENNSDGDWEEFGDNSVKIGWAKSVVNRIRETNQIKHPDLKKKEPKPPKSNGGCCSNDSEWQQNSVLPKLLPHDYYWIYNKENYYQIDKTGN
jgi:ATP-dependent Clp protease protease subunit